MQKVGRPPMKIRDVLKRLQGDGWHIVRQEGSHRILKHAIKPGIVVVGDILQRT